jgi:hypothetical protein
MRESKFSAAVILGVLFAGCGAKWNVTDQRFFKYQNKDVRVAGVIEMTEDGRQWVGGQKGVQLETRFYADEYETILLETGERVGKAIEEAGSEGKKEIFKLPITELRLGGTGNSYPRLCAEIKLKDSNVSEWTRVGCLDQADTPSESPTGGLGQEAPET